MKNMLIKKGLFELLLLVGYNNRHNNFPGC